MAKRPRSIRVSDEAWEELKRLAKENGTTVSGHMRTTALSKSDALRMLRSLHQAREQIDKVIGELTPLVRRQRRKG